MQSKHHICYLLLTLMSIVGFAYAQERWPQVVATPEHILADRQLPFRFIPTKNTVYDPEYNQYYDKTEGLYVKTAILHPEQVHKFIGKFMIPIELNQCTYDSIVSVSQFGHPVVVHRFYPKRNGAIAIGALIEYRVGGLSLFMSILQIGEYKDQGKLIKVNLVKSVVESIVLDDIIISAYFSSISFPYPKDVVHRSEKAGFEEYNHLEMKTPFPWVMTFKTYYKDLSNLNKFEFQLNVVNKYLDYKTENFQYLGIINTKNYTFHAFRSILELTVEGQTTQIPIELYFTVENDFLFCIRFFRYPAYDTFLGYPRHILESAKIQERR